MFRAVLILMLCCAVLALSGCNGDSNVRPATPPSDYSTYVEFERDRDQRTTEHVDRLLSVAETCDTDSCRQAIASNGFVFLAGASGGGQRTIAPPPPPPVKRSGWDIALALVDRAIPFGQLWGQREQAKFSLEGTRALYGFLGSSIDALANSPALQAPSIHVGNDWVGGDQHHGDRAGRDQIGGSQRNGHDINTGDINTGTQNRGVIGSGRQASPDIDNGNTGPRCLGDNCQGELLPPLPVPPPEEDGGE